MDKFEFAAKVLDAPAKKIVLVISLLAASLILLYVCAPRMISAYQSLKQRDAPQQQNNGNHDQGAGVNNGIMNQTNQ